MLRRPCSDSRLGIEIPCSHLITASLFLNLEPRILRGHEHPIPTSEAIFFYQILSVQRPKSHLVRSAGANLSLTPVVSESLAVTTQNHPFRAGAPSENLLQSGQKADALQTSFWEGLQRPKPHLLPNAGDLVDLLAG